MLKPLISSIALSTGILLMVGCEQTTVVKDNSVAAIFARSMPAGDVAQGNTIVQASAATAVNTPAMQNVSTALNKAQNTVGPATPAGSTIGGIANALSPANIQNAVHTALTTPLTPQQQLLQLKGANGANNPWFPPVVVGTFNAPILYGPGPVNFPIPNQ